MNTHASAAAIQADRAIHRGNLRVTGKILQADRTVVRPGREFAVHVVQRNGTVHCFQVDGRGFRRANKQIDRPIVLIPGTFRRYLAVLDGHGDLGQYSLCRIARARGGFACRHGIYLFVPAHDLYAAVAMWLNLQDGGFGLAQSALLGAHHGIPVVKPNAKIGTISRWLLVAVGSAYGVAMPVRSRARKAEGEQSRQRNQKKEVASRHGVLPAPIDDRGGDWSRAFQPKNHSRPSQSSVPMGGPSGGPTGGGHADL